MTTAPGAMEPTGRGGNTVIMLISRIGQSDTSIPEPTMVILVPPLADTNQFKHWLYASNKLRAVRTFRHKTQSIDLLLSKDGSGFKVDKDYAPIQPDIFKWN